MMPRGSVNAWECPTCGRLTVAVHVDEGVTPMFLACRAKDGRCQSMGVSLGYRPFDKHAVVEWEWAKPSATQMKRMHREEPDMYDHVSRGGLVLRPLTEAGLLALTEATA